MNRRAFFFAAATLLAFACSRPDVAAEPAWDKQPCAHCSMLMSDRRFGAQILTSDGDRLFFDDVGCMVAFEEKIHPKVSHEWVKNAAGSGWSEARSARYAGNAPSPMGFGFAADPVGDRTFADVRASVIAREEASR